MTEIELTLEDVRDRTLRYKVKSKVDARVERGVLTEPLLRAIIELIEEERAACLEIVNDWTTLAGPESSYAAVCARKIYRKIAARSAR